QLDLMYHYFGEIENAHGFSINTNELYSADDVVSGQILFKNKIVFNGTWCFNIGENSPEDFCEIIGEKGRIQFSFFDKQEVKIISNSEEQIIPFEKLMHAQQPMIEKVVNYFLDKGSNPCPVEEGVKVMEIMEKFTAKK
ncbi:MAG: Gfo/Idh/MocA family oxidoreductase, partial [Ginsengibacter sp.]